MSLSYRSGMQTLTPCRLRRLSPSRGGQSLFAWFCDCPPPEGNGRRRRQGVRLASHFRLHPFVALVLTVVVPAVQLHAEDRKYVLGAAVDLVGGGTSQPNTVGRGSFLYEMYPSIQLRSTG